MNQKLSKVAIAVMSVLFAGAASAADVQDPSGDKQGTSGRNQAEGVINAGGFEIRPTLGLAIGKNNNVGMASAARNSSNLTKLTPKVVVEMPTQGQVYSATYAGTYTRYSTSAIDNYTDHNFGLAAKNDWSTRVNSLVNIDYNKGHDGRNDTKNVGTPSGFVEHWHTTGIKGMAHYGAEGAQGQFELSAGQVAKRYDSNNSGLTQRLNNDVTSLKGEFFYKVAPATQMIAQIGTATYKYVDPVAQARADSTELQYMMGVKWEATAKTTGSFRIGQVKKSFKTAGVPSNTNTAWDADVTWSPLTYSNVNFSLHQKAAESNGTGGIAVGGQTNVGGSIVMQDSNVDWTHEWSSQVKSKLSFGDGVDRYQLSTQVNKRQTYGAKVSYQLNRWLNAGVDYQNTRRNSTLNTLNYTQNIVMLVLDGTL